jgi:hypothetical protein
LAPGGLAPERPGTGTAKIARAGTAIDRDWARDAGMAFVLLCLLGAGWSHARWLEWTATAALVVDMIWPALFTPFAFAWFGLSEVMDALVVEDFVFDKAAQKPWTEEDRRKALGAYGVD